MSWYLRLRTLLGDSDGFGVPLSWRSRSEPCHQGLDLHSVRSGKIDSPAVSVVALTSVESFMNAAATL